MANIQNLKTPSTSEARERGKKGGQKSGEARRRRQQIREVVATVFDGSTYEVDGEQLTAEQAIAKRLVEVVMDPNHKDWYKVLELLVKLTDSDRNDRELELYDQQLDNQLANIREDNARDEFFRFYSE